MTILKQQTDSLNREAWLNNAKASLSAYMINKGVEVPHDLKISCGWCKGGKKAIGSCHNRESSANNINEIFISPEIFEAQEVIAILAHEFIHASDDCVSGHKAYFSQSMKKIGLIGKPTATIAGEDLLKWIDETIKDTLGDYPHAKVMTAPPKQSTRMHKMHCTECDWSFYASVKMIDEIVNNNCMCCEEEGTIELAPKKKK